MTYWERYPWHAGPGTGEAFTAWFLGPGYQESDLGGGAQNQLSHCLWLKDSSPHKQDHVKMESRMESSQA